MLSLSIRLDSETPASAQLISQISFAIATGQVDPGARLPSTRQLAMQTGLHRNTINKVYRQLEQEGWIEARSGSGIYVRHLKAAMDPVDPAAPPGQLMLQQCLDELLEKGYSLAQAKELFDREVEGRLRNSAHLYVTAPRQDFGIAELMGDELQLALNSPVQRVMLEELESLLQQNPAGTVITSRYYFHPAEAVALPHGVRVLPVEVYDFHEELELFRTLPINTCVGIVCRSVGLLQSAQKIVQGLRGDDLFLVTAPVDDEYQLRTVILHARLILTDLTGQDPIRSMLQDLKSHLIRLPQVICCENYLNPASLVSLKRELGMTL